MAKLRVLDLFSGIGGFSLGLERATGHGKYTGFETVAFCEIEEFPRKVLAKHWPDVPCYHDVRELTAERLAADGIGEIDVICGGFPCQDISFASDAGTGIAGARSGLWAEYARLVGQLRPRFVIVENVAALCVRGIDTVLLDLAAFGYDAEWHCIPASAVGAPHPRDRVWIVAYSPEVFGKEQFGHQPRRLISGDGLLSFIIDEGRPHSFAHWRTTEPTVARGAHGVSNRVDRLGCLSNAVVPQIPELIGNAILASLSGHCAPQLPEAQREGMSGSRGGIHCDAATAPLDNSERQLTEADAVADPVLTFHETLNSLERQCDHD